MVATSAHIGFITQPMRNSVAGPDAGVELKYGEQARDTKDEPVISYFADRADAQVAANERLALLSPDRRLLQFIVSGTDEAFRHLNKFYLLDSEDLATLTDSVDGSILIGAPTNLDALSARVIDDDRMADHFAMISQVAVDYDAGVTEILTWG